MSCVGVALEGTCLGWREETVAGHEHTGNTLEGDGTDVEHLDQLCHLDVDLTFLPYANGNPAPRLTGRAAARLQREEAADAPCEKVIVEYELGGQVKQQVWEVLAPDAVTVDQRTQDFEEPKLSGSSGFSNSLS